MNDQELFTAFIQALLQGKSTLVSNPSYRVESAFGTLQLVDNKSGVIATVKLGETPLKLSIKRHIDCWEELRQTLGQFSFFPDVKALKTPLVPFIQVAIPEGDQLYESLASEVWRSWRRGAVKAVKVLVDGEWQAVQDITCSSGVVFFIFNPGPGEVQTTGNTQLAWLGQAAES